jgi:cold shock CspA family protein
MPAGGPRPGTVTAFDDDRGLGTVTDDDGTSYDFHCTALTDGSRHVAVGTRVTFLVAAGHLGRMEARRIGSAR